MFGPFSATRTRLTDLISLEENRKQELYSLLCLRAKVMQTYCPNLSGKSEKNLTPRCLSPILYSI